jgi:putative sterol carrier protein
VGDVARKFFETLPEQASPERTAGINKTYRFVIDGAGTWTVSVTDGGAKVTEDGSGDVDATVSTSEETFEKLLNREQSPTTAFMLGKVKVDGDMGAVMKLQKLFSSG